MGRGQTGPAAGLTAPRNQSEADISEMATQRLAETFSTQRQINSAARQAQQIATQRGVNLLEAVEFVISDS